MKILQIKLKQRSIPPFRSDHRNIDLRCRGVRSIPTEPSILQRNTAEALVPSLLEERTDSLASRQCLRLLPRSVH